MLREKREVIRREESRVVKKEGVLEDWRSG